MLGEVSLSVVLEYIFALFLMQGLFHFLLKTRCRQGKEGEGKGRDNARSQEHGEEERGSQGGGQSCLEKARGY